MRIPRAVLFLAATACTGTGGTDDTDSADTEAAPCTARVLIGFYPDDTCTPGTETGQRSYDTSLDCFSWTASGSGAEENSATRFQCWSDRICYTQHADTLTCEESTVGPTDKEAFNDVCLKEPAGTLYSKILSGNEDCPAPPDGFECPASEATLGTAGIVACTLP